MALFGAAYNGPSKIHYLFIDGGALRGRINNISDKFFNKQNFDVDFARMLQLSGYTKGFYYDAIPVRKDNEPEGDYETRIAPIRGVFNSALSVDRMHVYEGDARTRKRRGLEQKKVDVMLTVDMLSHTFKRNMHEATLLTGDADFKPLVDALVHEGMFINVWFPPDETSKELVDSADARRPLDLATLKQMMTDESRARFTIPQMLNKDPSIAPAGFLSSWKDKSRDGSLYLDAGTYTVTMSMNDMNRTHITHENIDFIKFFCKENTDIDPTLF